MDCDNPVSVWSQHKPYCPKKEGNSVVVCVLLLVALQSYCCVAKAREIVQTV